MKQNISEILSQQINKEFFSSYLYLEFHNYLMDKGLQGFANWFRIQVREESDHGMLFYDYLHHNNVKVKLEAIEKPTAQVNGVMDILKASLAHEEFITQSINDIYELALAEKDYRTKEFLDWFVKEQGEEEANFNSLIDKVNLVGEDSKGLYILDQELATRQYSPPSLIIS